MDVVPKYEVKLFTTDGGFVDDFNSASIADAEACYRPTMAFDSVEPLWQIAVDAATATALKAAADWIVDRFKKQTPKQLKIVTQNKFVEISQLVVVINQIVEKSDDQKP